MAVVHLIAAARNAACDAIVDLADAGSGAGTIKIYSGSIPATAATAVTGTLLATITLVDPAFGAASSGAATIADPTSVNAAATGTAGYFRMADSAGTTVLDGDVTATGGGGALTLSTTSLVSGSPVDITGGTITMPSGE